VVRDLHYTRGTAEVRIVDAPLEIPPGIYALTGANGSGKSTLFRVLMSCETNDHSIDLPTSIQLLKGKSSGDDKSCEASSSQEGSCTASSSQDEHASIVMPSSDVVEISQTFYWPLYAKPIDWIYQTTIDNDNNEEEETLLELRAQQVAEELQSMAFFQKSSSGGNDDDDNDAENSTSVENDDDKATNKADLKVVMNELLEEKEDWFGDLSGGQKSKVELVRQVFLQEECPKVLLIDETMAPLDPTSKSLVMKKLKDFCRGESVVIVIYHADVGHEQQQQQEQQQQSSSECVPSNNFFDANLHLENKAIQIRPVCG